MIALREEEVQMGIGGPTGPAASPESKRECRALTRGMGPGPHAKILGSVWDFTSLGTTRQVLNYFWGGKSSTSSGETHVPKRAEDTAL